MIVEFKGHIRPHCFKLHSYAHKKFFEKDVEKNGFFFDKLAIRSRTFKKDFKKLAKKVKDPRFYPGEVPKKSKLGLFE